MPNTTVFSLGDIYPAFSLNDTSTKATPTVENLEVLHEDEKLVAETKAGYQPKRNIFLGLAVIVGLIILLGGGSK